MTPAVNSARKAKIDFKLHQYAHDPAARSYGEEAAAKMGVSTGRVFKTLVVSIEGKTLAVAVLPVSDQLDLKSYAAVLGAKKTKMADPQDVERSTGYVLGGVSPLGQKKRLKTVIDAHAKDHQTIYVSAGRRGIQIELTANDLAKLTGAIFASICHQRIVRTGHN